MTMDHLTAATGAEDAGSSSSSNSNSPPKKREYPADPLLPDINSSMYSTDEFRMFSFKVHPCCIAYSHDWTECPFAHPGENARRRDPRRHHYSCVPCPKFRREGECRKGDMCEYAHGIFEIWLHPGQYRTRMCKDGANCTRKVCFFAHHQEELRPLYASSGSAVPIAVPSPLSMEHAAALYFRGSPVASPRAMMPVSPRPNMQVWVQPATPPLLVPFIPPGQMRPAAISVAQQARAMNMLPSNLDAIFSVESAALGNPFQQQGMASPPRNMAPVSPSTSRVTMPSPVQQFSLGSASSSSSVNGASSSSSTADIWAQWGSPTASQPDWSIDPEFAKLKRPTPLQVRNEEQEPDVSWVQSLVTEPPQQMHTDYAHAQDAAARFHGMQLDGHNSQY